MALNVKKEFNFKINIGTKNANIICDKQFELEDIKSMDIKQESGDIIIYIPSKYSNEIKARNDYGNCEITNLPSATINIDCDAGNVEIGKIKNAVVKCDYGNIDIKEILNKCDIKADCGNIKIDTVSINENSSIKADLGNIDINNTNDIYIETDVELGKTNINKSNRNAEITLKINCDCGNITINN